MITFDELRKKLMTKNALKRYGIKYVSEVKSSHFVISDVKNYLHTYGSGKDIQFERFGGNQVEDMVDALEGKDLLDTHIADEYELANRETEKEAQEELAKKKAEKAEPISLDEAIEHFFKNRKQKA